MGHDGIPSGPHYVAAARFDLALAHLGQGDLEAVGEHLAPVLQSTEAGKGPARAGRGIRTPLLWCATHNCFLPRILLIR